MSVFKDKCLVVLNQGKKAQFINPDVQGALQQAPQFIFEAGKVIVNILLVENQYVVAVFETHVAVYNATTGDLLQQDANLEGKSTMKYKYRNAAVKIQTNNADSISDVYLLTYNLVEKKQTIQSEIYMMKEIGWEQQIDQLLYSNRITEAREVFLTRGNKRAENYMQRLKMFNLNAGWIMLMNSVDYVQVVNWFK
jgi:hypothetical protein